MSLKRQKELMKEYCELKVQEKELSKKRKEIEKELKGVLQPGNDYEVGNYILKVSERTSYEYDPKTVYNMVKRFDIFSEMISIKATEAKKYLSPIQLSKAVVKEKNSLAFTVKEK